MYVVENIFSNWHTDKYIVFVSLKIWNYENILRGLCRIDIVKKIEKVWTVFPQLFAPPP